MAGQLFDRPRMAHLGKLAKDVETFNLVRTSADETVIRAKLDAAMQLLDEAALMCGAMDRLNRIAQSMELNAEVAA